MKPLYWCGYTLLQNYCQDRLPVPGFGQENIIENGPDHGREPSELHGSTARWNTCRSELYFWLENTFRNMLFGSILPESTHCRSISRADLTAVERSSICSSKDIERLFSRREPGPLTGEIQPARAGIGA
jgi:hypothetical protein